MSDDEFETSELGTKCHWDDTYKKELENFAATGDVGEIWFGEDSAHSICSWLSKNMHLHSNILDLGCGNGMTLMFLSDEGFINLYGVDYSEYSIELAKSLAEKKGANVHFEVGNICEPLDEAKVFQQKFNVVLDKGTYDAVSLNPENALKDRAAYINNLPGILEDSGFFIITSCNWTADELEKQFEETFSMSSVIPTPTFMFGGKIGNAYTSVVFKKR